MYVGGAGASARESRIPFVAAVSSASTTFSPVNAFFTKRFTSRTRAYGFSNGTPPHCSTMTDDPAPRPSTKRPGAASATPIALIANVNGARVYTLAIAVPRRNDGAHCDARSSGVNASMPSTSADHTSV